MAAAIGHNRQGATVGVERRSFNSVARLAENGRARAAPSLPTGSTLGKRIGRLGIPAAAIHPIMVNRRDVTPGRVGAPVNRDHETVDGDVVALSGPAPYSDRYGAPVVRSLK